LELRPEALVFHQSYAWHGMSLREAWILHPETIARGELKHLPADFRKYVETRVGKPTPAKKKAKTSDLFKAALPADPAARLKWLRDHAGGSLPLFERYVAGEYNKVWSELVAMGPAVREEPIVADALAVAYETMRRVEANVQTVVGRLRAMNYRFHTSEMALDMDREGGTANHHRPSRNQRGLQFAAV
jgi:hypothetical protein